MLLAGGREEADRILRVKALVTEDMIHILSEHVSNEIIETEVGDIDRYMKYFDEDAWSLVSDLGNILIPLKMNFLVTVHISFLVARKHAESTAEMEDEFTREEYTADIPSARRTSSGRQSKKPRRFIE
jgi:hypothetical protein